jgi:hypothetical protein
VENPEEIPEDVILGIKPEGIAIYDLERVIKYFNKIICRKRSQNTHTISSLIGAYPPLIS